MAGRTAGGRAIMTGVEFRGMARGLPRVIQGGMGVGISHWRLARAVSEAGQLGVVSGTALDQILVRRLQDGDPGGHMRRALDRFPFPAMAGRVWAVGILSDCDRGLRLSLESSVRRDRRQACAT